MLFPSNAWGMSGEEVRAKELAANEKGEAGREDLAMHVDCIPCPMDEKV